MGLDGLKNGYKRALLQHERYGILVERPKCFLEIYIVRHFF
jgi:hypothetical protein